MKSNTKTYYAHEKNIQPKRGIKLTRFCKNCGCHISENEQFCPDCGKPTENRPAMKFCPNCGEEIDTEEYFCRNCDMKLKERQIQKESTLDKYKTPIIILAVIVAIAIVAFGAYSSLGIGASQDVRVDTISLTIPDSFEENEDMKISENDGGVIYKSKFWQNDEDYIQIDVMYSTSYLDADEIAKDMGGEKKNMLGYDGYYNDLDDAYSFTFVESNKLVSIYTSNYDLLSQIEVV